MKVEKLKTVLQALYDKEIEGCFTLFQLEQQLIQVGGVVSANQTRDVLKSLLSSKTLIQEGQTLSFGEFAYTLLNVKPREI